LFSARSRERGVAAPRRHAGLAPPAVAPVHPWIVRILPFATAPIIPAGAAHATGGAGKRV
jgi:hypothetical protein